MSARWSSFLESGRKREGLIAFLASWALLTAWQLYAGSFTADFNGFPDESSHVVSTLMVRQFLTEAFGSDPFVFAARYYAHYPSVGVGHWPPAFYFAGAAWTLVFGANKTALFAFVSALHAGTAALLYSWVRRLAGTGPAGPATATTAAALWCLGPLTVFTTTTFLAESLLAFLCFGAVLVYASYLERPRLSAALGFGLLAAGALLTKGSAIALALVPPLAVVVLRRPRLLGRLDFWAPAVVAATIAGLWYVPLSEWTIQRAADLPRTLGPWQRLHLWVVLLGALLAGLAALGWVRRFAVPAARGAASEGVTTAGAFVAATAVLHQLLPESQEPRHLLQAAPFAIAFGVLEARDWTHRLAPRRQVLALLLLGLICAASSFRIQARPSTPYGRAAADLLANPDLDDAAIVISTNRYVEGVFVAETAVRSPRPSRVLVRANKYLARTGWNRHSPYEANFPDNAALLDELLSLPAAALALEDVRDLSGARPHHRQLLEIVGREDSPWILERRYAGDVDLLVYRLRAGDPTRRRALRIEIGHSGIWTELPPPSAP